MATIQEKYNIGNHIKKQKTIKKTVESIQNETTPNQVFLGSPRSGAISIKDDDVAESTLFIKKLKINLFVHTPYIINLSKAHTDKDKHTNIFIENIKYSVALGCKGVVIHVGKYLKDTKETAIKTMKKNIDLAMKYATEECPILLETPAGQGTELLTDINEFYEFVDNINDKRVQICVDTCHVYSTGYDPLEYLKAIYKKNKKIIKLVHFNDSKTKCDSHVDRHAYIGTGTIGLDKMEEIALFCNKKKIPMVVE